jgi:hypothetical protein
MVALMIHMLLSLSLPQTGGGVRGNTKFLSIQLYVAWQAVVKKFVLVGGGDWCVNLF